MWSSNPHIQSQDPLRDPEGPPTGHTTRVASCQNVRSGDGTDNSFAGTESSNIGKAGAEGPPTGRTTQAVSHQNVQSGDGTDNSFTDTV